MNRPSKPGARERRRLSREGIPLRVRSKKPELEARLGVRRVGLLGLYSSGGTTEQRVVGVTVGGDPSFYLGLVTRAETIKHELPVAELRK